MPERDLELVIWQLAAKVYGESLCTVIHEILSSYRREPGLDDLTRLFESSIGQDVFKALNASLADLGDDDGRNPGVISFDIANAGIYIPACSAGWWLMVMRRSDP